MTLARHWLIGLIAGSLVILVGTCCQTMGTADTQHCDQYIRNRVTELMGHKYQLAGGMDRVLPNGVANRGDFVNQDNGTSLTELMVDTPELQEEAKKAGFHDAATCTRGSKEWFILRRTQEIQQEPGQQSL